MRLRKKDVHALSRTVQATRIRPLGHGQGHSLGRSSTPAKLTDEQAQTIKMNAITEWSALPATEMFLRDNRDDSDFSAFMSIWFFEEQKHSLVLMEYLRALPPRARAHREGTARGALRVRSGARARDPDAALLRRDPPEPLVPPRQPSGTPSR